MNQKKIIPFHKPLTKYFENLNLSELKKYSGAGPYTKKCEEFLEEKFRLKRCLLTTSCTDALEMAALLIDIQPGDEVIMPSYTFVSTANAFILRGGVPVFVDIRRDTMNIDETLIESAITSKTKAVIPVHYAGVPCEMDTILSIAKKYDLYVIEDAAQAVMSRYKGKYCGSMGDLGTFSFHETKNFHCGEGGALTINNEAFSERAEVIREKGTNRSKFIKGQVDKYTWVDIGSSFLPSEVNSYLLNSIFENIEEIHTERCSIWHSYFKELEKYSYNFELPTIPLGTEHNGHIFLIKTANEATRDKLIDFLSENNIQSTFHYVPLHTSPAGKNYGRFHGKDNHTTQLSSRIVRFPLYGGLQKETVLLISNKVRSFFEEK